MCKHGANDPSCSSNRHYVPPTPTAPATPDAANYEIVDVERVGKHLVLKVKYPNCRACAYEGTKVLVFLDVTEIQVLKWRKIDPHFRAESKAIPRTDEAPSPAGRFPASPEGWVDALAYARSKAR